IEVKTRTSLLYGSPAEAVDMKKQRHIRNAARYFLSRYNREWDSLNFQVIEISIGHITGLEL
ncbi:MAG: YraN family protein, partial [Firmicutes bacterium]|nr:YraN family protein [Bacillota bacterium]